MTTSGTVAQTQVDTATLIEHALRRCGVAPGLQTPEIVQIAQDNLFLLLLALANRGINLWCVQKTFVAMTNGTPKYNLPAGTISLLNAIHSAVTQLTGTDSVIAGGVQTTLGSASQPLRIGVNISAVPTSGGITVQSSSDGSNWTTRATIAQSAVVTGYNWVEPATLVTAQYWRATVSSGTIASMYLAATVYDTPMTQFSRDEYAQMNKKLQQGTPSTNFYYEKTMTQTVTVWPVPNADYNHLTVFTHRQVQDVGTLAQTVEIPQRWAEDTVWQLAKRMMYELPAGTVDMNRLNPISSEAEKSRMEAEWEETDGAPISIVPQIRVYTA